MLPRFNLVIFLIAGIVFSSHAQNSPRPSAGAISTDTSQLISHAKREIDSRSNLQHLPSRYFNEVSAKANGLNHRLTHRTEKALHRLQIQEEKINRKLSKIDSVTAHNLFVTSIDSLSHLQELIKRKISTIANRIPGGQYIPYLDTLQSSLNFLNKYSSQLSEIKGIQQKLQSSLGSVQQLEGKLNQLQDIQQYIQERQQLLTQSLSQYGDLFNMNLGNIGKEAYYYQAQIQNYKEIWSQPDKMEATAIELFNKIPAFTVFMQKNSMLASIFQVSQNNVQNPTGLQTRSQVAQLIQQSLAGTSPEARQAISQQMQQAREQLNQLKAKFPALNSAAQMPNFQPNEMKNKTFFQRLEYGANVGFEKASNFFPTTSDLAAQIAYRFSENGSFGVGSSFKLGCGNNIRKINFK